MKQRTHTVMSFFLLLSILPIHSMADVKVLPVPVIEQEPKWCYAASLQAVLAYAGFFPRQCEVVNLYHFYSDPREAIFDCCNKSQENYSSICVHGGYSSFYDSVLAFFGIPSTYKEGQINSPQVDAHIQLGYPLIVSLAWESGGGHAIVVRGFDTATATLHLMDPGPGWGYQIMTYEDFAFNDAYGDSGDWYTTCGVQVDPSPPYDLVASWGTETHRIELAWTASPLATAYEVWRTSFSGPETATLIAEVDSSRYWDWSVDAGTLYEYYVKAKNPSRTSGFSNLAVGLRAMPTPLPVRATHGDHWDKVVVTWNPVQGATYYTIYADTYPSTPRVRIGTVTATNTSFDYTDATHRTHYNFAVKAHSAIMESDFSGSVTGWTEIGPVIGVTASNGGYLDSVHIAWSPLPGAQEYEIYRCVDPGEVWVDEYAGTVSAPSTGFVDTPPDFARYYYRVRAVRDGTPADFAEPVAGRRGVSVPSNVTASDGTLDTEVFVSWNPSPDAVEYKVYRDIYAPLTFPPATPIATTTNTYYHDYSADAGTTYCYWVKSSTAHGTSSDYSSPNTGYRGSNIPYAPTNVSASNGTYTDRVRVTWDSYIGIELVTHKVYRSDSVNGGKTLLFSTTDTSYNDTTASMSATYYYWVTRSNDDGESGFSAYDTGFRGSENPPSPPTGVSATKGDHDNRVRITWQSYAGVLGYEIWRNTVADPDTATLRGVVSRFAGSVFDDTGVTPMRTYFYWVKAASVVGISQFSAREWGWGNLPSPASVTASDGSSLDRVSVSWPGVPGATSYKVHRSYARDGLFSNSLIATDVTVQSYIDTRMKPDLTFYYAVVACNDYGCGRLGSYDTGYCGTVPRPATPSNVSASDGTHTDRVDVTWDPEPGAGYYHVYRADSSQDEKIHLGQTTDTSFQDTTAVARTTHYYWVASSLDGTRPGPYSIYDTGWKEGEPDILVSPSSHGCGQVPVGETSQSYRLMVTNEGTQTLHIAGAELKGDNPDQFVMLEGNGTFDLEPMDAHAIDVAFRPTAPGLKTASLRITSNDPDQPEQQVSLSGEGMALHFYVAPPPKGNDTRIGISADLPFATITKAIDVAQGSQAWPVTIHVAVGEYVENLVLNPWESIEGGWDLDFTQRWDLSDPFKTVVDGQYETVVVAADNTTIQGFTIRNGGNESDPYGGGIVCPEGAYVRIIGNDIYNNYTSDDGGGICVKQGSNAVIEENWIHDNMAHTGKGGGIYCDGSSPVISLNRIFRNSGANGGGGISYGNDASPTIFFNFIHANTNSSDYGGGIHGDGPTEAVIHNNAIIGNSNAGRHGGGIVCTGGNNPLLFNNTICANEGGTDGGGICVTDGSLPIIMNSIIWNNSDDLYGVDFHTIAYSHIGDGDFEGINHNIAGDPHFVDPDGSDNVFGTEDDDFHLHPSSRCIDGGDPVERLTVDYLGGVTVEVDEVTSISPGQSIWISDNLNSDTDKAVTVGENTVSLETGFLDHFYVSNGPYLFTDLSRFAGEPQPNGRRINMGVYGGTDEATTSADSDHDGDVDGADLVALAEEMGRDDCTSNPPCKCNLDRDDDVDEADVASFGLQFTRSH